MREKIIWHNGLDSGRRKSNWKRTGELRELEREAELKNIGEREGRNGECKKRGWREREKEKPGHSTHLQPLNVTECFKIEEFAFSQVLLFYYAYITNDGFFVHPFSGWWCSPSKVQLSMCFHFFFCLGFQKADWDKLHLSDVHVLQPIRIVKRTTNISNSLRQVWFWAWSQHNWFVLHLSQQGRIWTAQSGQRSSYTCSASFW